MATRDDLVAALSMGAGAVQPAAVDPRWQRLMQQLMPPAPPSQQMPPPVRGINPLQPTNQMPVQAPGPSLDDILATDAGPSMRSYDPTLRERLGNWAYDAMSGLGLPAKAEQFRGDVLTGTNAPIVDEALSAHEAGQALAGGDYGTAALLGAGILMPGPSGEKLGKVARAVAGDVAEPAARRAQAYPRAPLLGLDLEDHPAMISPSVTSTKFKRTDSDLENVPNSIEQMRQDPDVFQHNMELLRNPKDYPFLRPEMTAGTPDSIASYARDQLQSNLRSFTSRAGPEDWEAMQWYPSVRQLIDHISDNYDLNDASVAGAISALSPNADWNINIHTAQQLIDRWSNREYLDWDKGMQRAARDLKAYEKGEVEAGRKKTFTMTPVIQALQGKPLMGLEDDPKKMGMWIRLHEQAYGDPLQEGGHGFKLFNPNGTFGDFQRNKPTPQQLRSGQPGDISRLSWNSIPFMGNAVRSLQADGDRLIIGPSMGGVHKVRNFYNNNLAPFSRSGGITMDSHAISGGLLVPKSYAAESHGLASSVKGIPPAKDSARSGTFGTYGMFADSYRGLADELTAGGRPILPNQLQSVIWEMKRKLFKNVNAEEVRGIDALWNDYHNSRRSLEDTQAAIWSIGEKANARARLAR